MLATSAGDMEVPLSRPVVSGSAANDWQAQPE
jgi:hypothetical protein